MRIKALLYLYPSIYGFYNGIIFMDKKIKLPEIVMLIDAAFLNYVISDLKRYFEKMLNRPLREIDLSLLTTYLIISPNASVTMAR